jgi:hypothetical protein
MGGILGSAVIAAARMYLNMLRRCKLAPKHDPGFDAAAITKNPYDFRY